VEGAGILSGGVPKISIKKVIFKFVLKSSFLWATMVALFLGLSSGIDQCAFSQDDATQKLGKMTVVGCVTWWSHDAVGYHPAMFMRIENTSGGDIIGDRIRFQGRFTDLRNGYITVARKDQRMSIAKNQQIYVMLRGPSSFELPIDQNAWPSIECKAMARIGDTGDEATQDLIIAHLEPITMSDEEAQSQLARQNDLRRIPIQAINPNNTSTIKKRKSEMLDQAPPKPLLATAGGLDSPIAKVATEKKSSGKFSPPLNVPSIGEDFYVFEKYFGIPLKIEAPRSTSARDLTWARYKPTANLSDIFVGSRTGQTADVVAVTVPNSLGPKESELLSLARAFAGKMHGAQITNFAHSVRYLPSGRSELSISNSPTIKVLSYVIAPRGNDEAKTALVISHMPGEVESTFRNYAQSSDLLQVFLAAGGGGQ